METITYTSDLLESGKETYQGIRIMKETDSSNGQNRNQKIPETAKTEMRSEISPEHKDAGEKGKGAEQGKIWELYKEKSLRSNLWKLFLESYINEYKILQIHKSLENANESTLIMDLAIIWSKFVRTIILPAIGLFYWKERETIASLYKSGIDSHFLEDDTEQKQ